MEINGLIVTFERKSKLLRYRDNSIKKYISAVRNFLQIAAQNFDHSVQLTESEIDKYVFRKIEKHKISSFFQRLIVVSIDKFYQSILKRNL